MLRFRQAFLDGLVEAERYVGRYTVRRGHAFSDAVLEFAYSVIASQPLAFPAYEHPLLPGRALRRAVFRRKYILLYELLPDGDINLVYFHHASSDISQAVIRLDE